MSKIENGGPAFPVLPPVDQNGRECPGFPFPDQGMSLRDWFAGQALAGLNANASWDYTFRPQNFPATAETAYGQAEAMLAARAKLSSP